MKFRAPLLHQDAPRAHELSPERFHAEVLGARVAAVAGGADALLMSHSLPHSPFSFTSAMRTSVNGWRLPAWRREPVRRAKGEIPNFAPLPPTTASPRTLWPFPTRFPPS